jgi:hypothetical protein
VQITVKVNPARAKSATAVVREHLKAVHPDIGEGSAVEEVFPGVRSGRRAGMVTVKLPQKLSHDEVKAVITALQSDEAIEYAEAVTPRKSRK